MDYDQINREIKTTQSAIRDLTVQIRNTEKSIGEINDSIDAIRSNQEERIRVKREETLNQQISELSKPYELEIKKLREKQVKLKDVLDKHTSKYTFDECAKKYSDEYKIVNQALDALRDVEDLGSDFLGENFSKQLYHNMKSVQIQPENLDQIVVGLKRYQKNILAVRRKSSKPLVKNYLDIFLNKVNPYKGDDEHIDTNSLVLYACCCAILLFSVVLFGAWIYMIALCVMIALNISVNYFIYKMLYYSKILNDNTEDISKTLEDKVEKDRSAILEKLNIAYSESSDELERNISEQQIKMRSAIQGHKDKFIFNDTDILKELEESIKNKEANKASQESNLASYKEQKLKLNRSLNQLQEQLERIRGTLIDDFLNCDKCGDEFILKTKYIIDEQDGSPVFWDFPMQSCLFIHDTQQYEISNFIKLISIQILNTMNPFAYSISYWDVQELGMDVQMFNPLSDINLFNLETDVSDIKKAIEDMMFQLRKRSANIRREYSDINQYNESMLSLESVTESYNIIFVPAFNKSIMTQDMYSLIYKGAEVGIYPIMFITLEDLVDLKDDSARFLNQFGTIYEFDSDSIKKRPAEFYKRKIEMMLS